MGNNKCVLMLALFAAAAIMLVVGSSKPAYSQQQELPQAKKAQQSGAPNQKEATQPPIVVNVLPTPKTETEAADERRERHEKAELDRRLVDLTAELSTYTGGLFKATVILAAATIVLCLVTAGLVAFAHFQSQDMKKSIGEAVRSADAIEVVGRAVDASAKAAVESVATIKDRTAQQMRAYLSVIIGSGAYQEREKNLRFEARPMVVNNGHTPARKVSYWARAAILTLPVPENFTFPVSDQPSVGGASLGPQQHLIMTAVVPDLVNDAEVDRIKIADGKALCVWGVVTYDDVFGQSQQTKFSQIITWLRDGTIYGYYTHRHNEGT